jgi:hypothetical protein
MFTLKFLTLRCIIITFSIFDLLPCSSGGRVNKPFRGGAKRVGGGGGAARGSGGKRGGRGAKREPAPSREELDKELDSYLKAR